MARNDDLEGLSLVDVLAKLERWEIGYQTAMDWLHIDSLERLNEIMSANGRVMPGHQPMEVTPETRELLRRIWRPVPATGGAAKKTKTVRPKSHAKGSTCIST
jgi:hypothetical protein